MSVLESKGQSAWGQNQDDIILIPLYHTCSSGWPLLISWSAIALAFAFSGAVGIFFGFYPARKAAQLDPIQALRYE
jgi:ABC-type antimicrobial peptide transport system permease subunit